MKKTNKFFLLLGLGIGIIATNIIYSILPEKKVEISDTEVIKRAEELGMIGIKDKIQKDKIQEEKNKEKIEVENNKKKDNKKNIETVNKTNKNNETKKITIKEGDSLSVVADKLYDLELIQDKDSFKANVNQKGLSKSLKIGSFEIKEDQTDNQIIEVITR